MIPFKKKKEPLLDEERLNILRGNIHLLLAQLKDTPKSLDELTIYIMRKGQHVNFSETEVRSEIIRTIKTIEEYKIVDDIDRIIANKKEHETMKVKFKEGVYCPRCHAKITELPNFTSFKCKYCDTVFLV